MIVPQPMSKSQTISCPELELHTDSEFDATVTLRVVKLSDIPMYAEY